MVDPMKLQSFLSRTMSALKKAEEAGDMENMDRYSGYLDRSKPLVEKAVAQPQQAQNISQDPTMKQDAGNQQLGAPPPAPMAQPQAQPQAAPPVAMPQGSMGTPGPAAPPASAGWDTLMNKLPQSGFSSPLPTPFELQMPSERTNHNAGIDILTGVKPKATAPNPREALNMSKMPTTALQGEKPLGMADIQPEADSLAGGALFDLTNIPEINQIMGLPTGVKQPTKYAPKEKAPAIPGEAEPTKLGKPALGEDQMFSSMMNAARKSVTDKEEADELARIEAEVGAKPEGLSLENLMVMLLMGAPKAFSKMMAEESDWKNAMRSAKAGSRKNKQIAARQVKEDDWREREVTSKELGAASTASLNKARIQAMPEVERQKALRAMINSDGFSETDEDMKAWASAQLGAPRPPR